MKLLEARTRNNKQYYVFPGLETHRVTNATSTRDFGDEEELVRALNLSWDRTTTVEQVHKDQIAIVDVDAVGKKKILGCDGLITQQKNVPLAIRTADCLAIILFDPKTQSLGMAHAGWRGSFQNIAGKLVDTMKRTWSTRAQDMIAAMSPSIAGCCYVVTENVLGELRKSTPQWQKYVFEEEGQMHLDLKAMNRDQLVSAGIPRENIAMSLYCTCCMNDQFFSYRKEGIGVGRLTTVAMMT